MIKELMLASLMSFHGHPISPEDLTQGQIDELVRVETQCLAMNVYHESRNQGTAGQIAVAHVTINRVKDSRFPNTVCGVVYQGLHRPSWKGTGEMIPVRHKCQFSWYCDGKKDVIWANYERSGKSIKLNAEAWRKSVEVAIWTLGYGSYTVNDNTGGSLYYYAHNLVYPYWADSKTLTKIIGNHTFMK